MPCNAVPLLPEPHSKGHLAMDRILRTYAHTAWTPADPLAGLDDNVRRAILLMPSTFRERWKLAPWTNRHQRRMAIVDIVAERRLLYELTYQNLAKSAPEAAPPLVVAHTPAPTSPYYRYRLDLHHQALESIRQDRTAQELRDFETKPEARADHERRRTHRQALLDISIERAKLDMKELDLLAGHDPAIVDAAPRAARTSQRSKNKRRDRNH